MRTMILASAAALAFAVPAAAQDTTTEADVRAEAEPAAGTYTMTASQQTSYDAWPADRQAAYDAWSGDLQEYFWTLTDEQTQGWWVLTDQQRAQVYAMTPQQRTAAWAQIAAQLGGAAGGSAAADTTPAASPASTGNMRFVSSEMVQSAPPPKEEYPICTDGMTDGCINPRAAGKNYGNVPLDYWPGEPASEIEGPLPAKQPEG